MSDQTLKGRCVLLAEDEYFTAQELHRALTGLGANVIGPVATLERAIEAIEDAATIDAAVLDINLSGDVVYPAADLLAERGVPMLFATGYDRSVIPSRFGNALRCEKPVDFDLLRPALEALLSNNNVLET